MSHFSPTYKNILLSGALLALPLFAYLIWYSSSPQTLTTLADSYQQAGIGVKQDFQSLPTLPITQTDDTYQIEDTLSDGISIQYANSTLPTLTEGADSIGSSASKPKLNLSFPKDYSKPVSIKLDDQRVIQMTDLGGKDDYTVDTLTEENTSLGRETSKLDEAKPGLWQRILQLGRETSKQKETQNYLRYTSKDQRKSLLYAYQKDQATGEKKLKHWTLYQEGNGVEQEEYQFENAKVKVNEEGVAEVFYFGESDLKNEQVKAEVDSNLLERAQRTLAKEMGEDLLNGNKVPDFTIPKPYYLDREGNKHEAEWKWHEETKSLSVNFTPESYPVALDPTLQFSVPGMSNTGSVITGECANCDFGWSLVAGDFNADGRTDLAVGGKSYNTLDQGRVYIFYNDGTMTSLAANADVIITGTASSDEIGTSLEAGDFNADGRTDLAVGSYHYRVYLFYNDGSYPTSAASADVIIVGDGEFGNNMIAGDFNSDGRTDLAVGSYAYSSSTGRVYLFYNDGSIPTTNGTADVTITGEASSSFGRALSAGDLNSDGKIDLVVGARDYSTQTGRVYIFYNDGSIPTTAGTADVTITGTTTSNYFGASLATGDMNGDGKTDLMTSAPYGSANTGLVYIFYGDGSIPTTAGTADVTITNPGTVGYFGFSLVTGDMNSDGRTDLIASAQDYTAYPGAAYIFYGDGSIPTTTLTADVIISGEGDSNFGSTFARASATGDFNSDGKADLAVGGYYFANRTGRVYLFYSQNGQVNTNQSITGGTTGDDFGKTLATGDFNADGRMDLAVGAPGVGGASDNGQVYIFYGDGQIPTSGASADVIITNGDSTAYFGYALSAGDFNADGKTDLAASAYGFNTSTGRVYIFYGDGSIPTTSGTADVTITGETTNNNFGYALSAGDFNADGETDLAAAAPWKGSGIGSVYIFHNDGSIPTTAATADVTITGDGAVGYFGIALSAGDFNTDSKTDILVGSRGFGSVTGNAYIFYNDGSIPTTAATGDVIITGEVIGNNFGHAVTSGDFNADGRIDFAVAAYYYSSQTGRVYIFYNDGSIPTTAAMADVTITGAATGDYFGTSLLSGDLNADGRTDLVVGAYAYSGSTGRTYLFYNDGSIPTTAATADVTITGETSNNYVGWSVGAGDMNGDGRIDLIVGAYGNTSSTGKVYFYETRENFAWQIQRQPQPGSGPLRVGTNTTGQELKITGEAGSGFGATMTTGDLNSDGKADLIVGATTYATNTGRVYVFYSDGSLATGATNADVVITGEANSSFGGSITGDFNADGRVDLAVGAYSYGSATGRVYIFYNDGSIPTTAATADVTIFGETNSYFGVSLVSGDFNADGTADLAVGGDYYSANYTGRVYVFYNDGSFPTAAGSADVIITGESTLNQFGSGLTTGDLNADGKTDLVVGAWYLGKVYIFYGGSIVTENASGADVIIVGTRYFGWSLVAGDFNADGRTDLAVSDTEAAGSAAGKVRLFYNDGSIPTTTGTADVTITEASSSQLFGSSLAAGDFNADGRTDLVAGAYGYSSYTGRAFVFYNDGAYPSAPSSADVILTGGEATSSYFGASLVSGDFNADGRTDLAVGASVYSSTTGRVYVYTLGNDPVITGETTNNNFGAALTTGDFNADGRTDLAVGASGYSSSTGRAYIFYNDGSIPTTATTADVTITGESLSYFGYSLTSGDFNADGRTDLAVGAYGFSFINGATYLFYNDGSIPTTAATADVTITDGTAGTNFGFSLTSGDWNADGRTDLAVGAYVYSFQTGRAYIFYNDGSIPTTAGTADVTITGGATSDNFGYSLTAGDWNSDGRTDLAVGAYGYSSSTGRAYIFYNDGSIPTTAGTADVTITGEATSDYFGVSLTAGDWNSDGRTDLAVGAYGYSSFTGRAYIFYNDGSIPTTAGTADVTITGEATSNYFSASLTSGDFNADGRTDLAIRAIGYSSFTGRAYLFYNDGSIPTTAGTADVTITGSATNDSFGYSLTAGDFNADGRTDLAVGATGYSTSTGRVYVYTSEAAPTGSLPAVTSLKGTGKFKGTGKLR